MSGDELAAKRADKAAYARKWRATWTPEQKASHAAYALKQYHKKKHDPEYTRRRSESEAKARRRLRKEALDHYGGACSCCEETAFEFLAIDHIDGGGNKHRKEVSNGNGGYAFYLFLRREGWPEGFRVLCHNCNQAIGLYGHCPHQRLEPVSADDSVAEGVTCAST